MYEILVIAALILWIVIALGLIVTLIALVPRVRTALRGMEEHHSVFLQKALPVIEELGGVVEQTGQITTTLASSAELVDRTVIRTADSVERMLELAEERVSEVNALLEVAIEETEETFFSTAALLRALRIGGGRRKKRRRLVRGEQRRLG